MTHRELLRMALECSAVTKWQICHPNHGWIEVDCACEAVDVSCFLRQLGQEPWLIRLGDGNDESITVQETIARS